MQTMQLTYTRARRGPLSCPTLDLYSRMEWSLETTMLFICHPPIPLDKGEQSQHACLCGPHGTIVPSRLRRDEAPFGRHLLVPPYIRSLYNGGCSRIRR